MGIDIDGVMIVGADVTDVSCGDDAYEFADTHDMYIACRWYDAERDGQVIGFKVRNDVSLRGLDAFTEEVREKMKKFEEITSATPLLMGMQNVW